MSSSSSSSFIQSIIAQSQKSDINHLLNNQPFTDNYAPYSQNQLRDVHFNRDCAVHWNTFYKNNGRKAYRDRHYILREFSEMKNVLDSLTKKSSQGQNSEIEIEPSSSSTTLLPQRRSREHHDGGDEALHSERQDKNDNEKSKQQINLRHITPSSTALLLDFGCGVGNLCLPILEEYNRNNEVAVVASDLAQVAVTSLQTEVDERGFSSRVYAEASDLGSDHESNVVPLLCQRGVRKIFTPSSSSSTTTDDSHSHHHHHPIFSSLVFVLCSVPKGLWKNVVLNIVNSLRLCSQELTSIIRNERKRQDNNNTSSSSNVDDDDDDYVRDATSDFGGDCYLFFRDYCQDDLAMHRFGTDRAVFEQQEQQIDSNNNNNNKEQHHVKMTSSASNEHAAEHISNVDAKANTSASAVTTYMRTNGTLSHFFSVEEVENLFGDYFDIIELKVVTMVAPIRDIVSVGFEKNERKFIQGKFKLKNDIV